MKICTLKVAVPVPLHQLFDYLPPFIGKWQTLEIGCRVRVPFGRRQLVGIFMGFSENFSLDVQKLKPILEILDTKSLFSADILQLCKDASEYYHYPLGEVLIHALPSFLRAGKLLETVKFSEKQKKKAVENIIPDFQLNQEQLNAVASIQKAHAFQVFVLHGVTGSGKTEVYIQVIKKKIKENKQILVLVPEIGLTPQTIQRFQERFSQLSIVLHSGLTEKQKLHAWCLSRSNEAKIIIGTRSALFSPFANLGLIIVDEEHDLSFKQQEGFRYHARDLAIWRAHYHQIPIVLGSATPALETFYKAKQNKFTYLHLGKRTGKATLPQFKVIDIRNQFLEQGISEALLSEMKIHFSLQNQVMLFLNRRGFAPVVLCHACGWMISCKRCNKQMTYHEHSKRLHCHHCESQKFFPASCEACGDKNMQTIGQGTERLEFALQKYFPDISIVRIDRDSTRRKGTMEKILKEIQEGKHQILIGTQMLAKGHHFPNVTLVGIIDADGGFFSSDFRALERMGQLILQVAGRAGRMEKKGTVVIQTHHPEHPLLHQLFQEDYSLFAETLLRERAMARLPPYTHFALFRADAYQEDEALSFLQDVKNVSVITKEIQLLGPIPAPMPKRAGRYRAQLLIQASKRAHLQDFLKKSFPAIQKVSFKKRVRWSVDVDPQEML